MPSGRLHVLHNWGWDPQTVSAPTQLRDLLTDEEVAPGATSSSVPGTSASSTNTSERNVISMTDQTPGDAARRCPRRS